MSCRAREICAISRSTSLQLRGEDIKLPQVAGDRLVLIGGQVQRRDPRAAALAEQVGALRLDMQVALQSREHVRLAAPDRHDDRQPALGQAAQHARLLVRDPHAVEEIRGEQFGERARVELVALDLRVTDRAHPPRIRDDDLSDMRAKHSRDRERVSGRLQHDLVIRRQALREELQLVAPGFDPARTSRLAAVRDRHDTEVLMDVQSDEPQHTPPRSIWWKAPVGERQLRIRARSTRGSVAGAATYIDELAAQGN